MHATVFLITDIDECTLSDHDCHMYAKCTDTNGGYNCSCIEGFEGNGTLCKGKSVLYSTCKIPNLF